ncbi:MAG TPA: zinc-ribbon domain-containing protein [Phycisphaerae bacterium]|nr:zinc-ribbon domain-containing protein [Phycisphaerae bacterium]
MFLSITQFIVVAVIGVIVVGVWLIRRALADTASRTKYPRCRACGQSAPDGASFCGHCGARLT